MKETKLWLSDENFVRQKLRRNFTHKVFLQKRPVLDVWLGTEWWWFVLAEWLTVKRPLALFPDGAIVRDSPRNATRRIWTSGKHEFYRLCGMKLSGSDNHCTKAPVSTVVVFPTMCFFIIVHDLISFYSCKLRRHFFRK